MYAPGSGRWGVCAAYDILDQLPSSVLIVPNCIDWNLCVGAAAVTA